VTPAADAGTVVLAPGALESWAVDVLRSAGAAEPAARATARALLSANLRGLDSHGIVFLAFYLPRLRAGTTDGSAEPRVAFERPGLALIDGCNALGAYVATFAMEHCCTKAKAAGAAAVAVRNSSHFGAASCYTEVAAARGCFGIIVSNSDPGMAPEGALAPVLGTNPLSLAGPGTSRVPAPCLDIATSVVAQGKVISAARAGRVIPEGWAIGRDGRPTTDPDEALRNSVLPMADHKGFALAFMIDVLAGCLTGARVSPEIEEGPDALGPQGTGHFLVAVDVDALVPDDYASGLERLADAVHDAPRADWSPPFLIPGELEARSAAERADGIPLDDAVTGLLRDLGREYSVPFVA
jgi:LDH2 family malate/lactate/ureidoglycolate dehydrogenase